MNRAQIRAFGTAAILFAAFLLGTFWAFPWDRLAESILEETSRKAAAAGFRMDPGMARIVSRFPPSVEIRNMSLTNPLGSMQSPSVEVRLKPFAALAGMKPVLTLESPTAQLNVPGSRTLTLSGIAAEVDMSRSETRIVSLQVGGDLTLSGKLSWSFEKRRLSFADLAIRAPENLEPVLNLLRSSTGLRPEGNGQWRLRLP
jgi:hypothetical protein